MTKNKQIKLTLIRSIYGILPKHRECAINLGLRRIHQSVVLTDNPCRRGMINKINHLISVEEV